MSLRATDAVSLPHPTAKASLYQVTSLVPGLCGHCGRAARVCQRLHAGCGDKGHSTDAPCAMRGRCAPRSALRCWGRSAQSGLRTPVALTKAPVGPMTHGCALHVARLRCLKQPAAQRLREVRELLAKERRIAVMVTAFARDSRIHTKFRTCCVRTRDPRQTSCRSSGDSGFLDWPHGTPLQPPCIRCG